MTNLWVKGYVALASTLFVGSTILPAYAHADLAETVPSLTEALTTSPEELRLTFTESVEIAFSEVSIVDSEKTEIQVGELSLDPEDNKTLVVPIEVALVAGTYTVEWAVVSGDGHKIEGSYDMTIAP